MLDSSVSSRALGVAGAGLGPGPPVGLSNINAREIQCVLKDSGCFWARLLH